MDPDWPSNPPQTVICVLCKAAIPFFNGDAERFFRHLIADHQVYFNLNLLLEVSRQQPGVRPSGEGQVTPSPRKEASPPHLLSHDYARPPSEPDSTSKSSSESFSCKQDMEQIREPAWMETRQAAAHEFGAFDLSLFANNPSTSSDGETNYINHGTPVNVTAHLSNQSQFIQSSSFAPVPLLGRRKGGAAPYNQTVPSIQTDFAALDPISFVPKEPRSKRKRQTIDSAFALKPTKPDNPNRHLVPEDLQNMITQKNIDREIKFTLSQRMNTQMVVDDYVLKKKKGPYKSRGGRVINWKCVNDTCQYTAITWEGDIQDTSRQHNHPAQPELYIKKQTRARVRESLANDIQMASVFCEDRPVTSAVYDVVNETDSEVRDMIGSIDALKQAARRFNRKLQTKDVKPQSSQDDGLSSNVYVENLNTYEMGDLPADFRLGMISPSTGVMVEWPHVTVTKVEADDITRDCIEEGVSMPGVESDSLQTFSPCERDNIEELLGTSPTKEGRVSDAVISDC